MGKKLIEKIKYISRFLVRPLREGKSVFLLSYLFSIVLCISANILGVYSNIFLTFLLSISDCYLLACLYLLLRKVRVGWIVHLFVIFIATSEMVTVFFYHSLFSIHVIQLVLETNSGESSEFISAALGQSQVWIALVVSLLTAIVSFAVARYSGRLKTNRYIAVLGMILLLWSGVRQISSYRKIVGGLLAGSTAYCSEERHIPCQCTIGNRIMYGLLFNWLSGREISRLEKVAADTKVGECSYRCPLIVLIIGESYNKYHSSVYNPDYLNTTPRLLELKESGNLIPYTDAVTPFNLTSNVFRQMFSTWDEDCADQWNDHTLFPVLFRRSGYDVHFITNQFVMDSNDTWNTIGGTIFNNPQLSRLQFTSRNSSAYTYDEDLLNEIPDISTSRPTLLIVHLMGQHVGYDERYPEGFRMFTASDEKNLFGGEKGREIAAHYDNATYYNDYVVHKVLDRFRDRDAIGIYLSDHGEEVFDWRDHYERTQEDDISRDVAKYQYEIPMMFYCSDLFRENHPDIVKQIISSKDKPFINTDLPHILMYLAGISSTEYKEDRNILSENYNVSRKRMLNCFTDYDELMKQ